MHTQSETPYTKAEEAPQKSLERHSLGPMPYPQVFDSRNFKKVKLDATPQPKKMSRVRQLDWLTSQGTSKYQLAVSSDGNTSSDCGQRVQGLDSSDSFHRCSSEDSLNNPNSNEN